MPAGIRRSPTCTVLTTWLRRWQLCKRGAKRWISSRARLSGNLSGRRLRHRSEQGLLCQMLCECQSGTAVGACGRNRDAAARLELPLTAIELVGFNCRAASIRRRLACREEERSKKDLAPCPPMCRCKYNSATQALSIPPPLHEVCALSDRECGAKTRKYNSATQALSIPPPLHEVCALSDRECGAKTRSVCARDCNSAHTLERTCVHESAHVRGLAKIRPWRAAVSDTVQTHVIAQASLFQCTGIVFVDAYMEEGGKGTGKGGQGGTDETWAWLRQTSRPARAWPQAPCRCRTPPAACAPRRSRCGQGPGRARRRGRQRCGRGQAWQCTERGSSGAE